MTRVLIGLGSNLGDRAANLIAAAQQVGCWAPVLSASRIYETEPMYQLDQPPFLNAAILVETLAGPLPLLRKLKDVEADIGRLPRQRNGPREIDLDLIAYGNLQYRFRMGPDSVLEVPHPRLVERAFVLQPLADIDPEWYLPPFGQVAELLAATKGRGGNVVEWNNAELPV